MSELNPTEKREEPFLFYSFPLMRGGEGENQWISDIVGPFRSCGADMGESEKVASGKAFIRFV